tara:strand:- start:1683 stop:2051 length:369 start_codon:yes stop_codon:yes gene_type:complete
MGVKIMRNLLILSLLVACSASADNGVAYCNGLTNDNTRVELKLDIDNLNNTVTVDDESKFAFIVANKFNYVWETPLGNTTFTNILNKLDGSMVVLVPNADRNQPPTLRAQLVCVEEEDIKFE